jgi:uncharacterized UBP type Zn finger protein
MRTMAIDPHLSLVQPVEPDSPNACQDCLRTGSTWVHLRVCLTCGKVGCCDSSPNRHARAHAYGTGHPIVAPMEPGEYWRWCYFHQAFV